MSFDILYKNMALLLNDIFGDFTGYLFIKMSSDIFYNNNSLSSKILNESSDVLLEKMSLGVLYKNMGSP